jgi:membrane-bound lytic murein transglycosylase MltF
MQTRSIRKVAPIAWVGLSLLVLAVACSDESGQPAGDTSRDVPEHSAEAPAVEEQSALAARMAAMSRGTGDTLSLESIPVIGRQLYGDLPAMIERRAVRALVPYSKTYYFLDGGQQRGLAYESLKQFEKDLNEKLENRHLRVYVVIVPVSRDELISGLVDGYGDVAVGNLTITDDRRQLVDFSMPLMTGVDEVIVTGPGNASEAKLESLDDLSGREIVVRRSSSYYESLEHLNDRFRAAGRLPLRLTLADELLEDEDLLEMVNAGLVPIVVVDEHKASFWAQIFEDIMVREDLVVHAGGEIAWAFRKDSPELAKAVDVFVTTHKRGTLMGNILFNRYLKNTRWARQALSDQGRARFRETAKLFQHYAGEYGFQWLMVTAQAYQESGLDHSVRSPAGAVGIMQLLPSTAADRNVAIADIHEIENNIHAGVKYLRFIRDRYFEAADMDEVNKTLFAFAAYNAGPARVAGLRRKAEAKGFDPNVWFRNVEVIAAQEIGRETVQYVSNIFKYFIAYQRSIAIDEALAPMPAAPEDAAAGPG